MQTADITAQLLSLARGQKIASHLFRQRPDCDCCFHDACFDLITVLDLGPRGWQAAENSSLFSPKQHG